MAFFPTEDSNGGREGPRELFQEGALQPQNQRVQDWDEAGGGGQEEPPADLSRNRRGSQGGGGSCHV